jgi:hypothetical protein
MPDFTKLASYLNSFDKSSPNYDVVCFLKSKIAADFEDTSTVNNGEEEDLDDNDVTMNTPEHQSEQNTEGDMMDGAFKELDALNQIDKQKEMIDVGSGKSDKDRSISSTQSFGDNAGNQKQASVYDLLIKRIKK